VSSVLVLGATVNYYSSPSSVSKSSTMDLVSHLHHMEKERTDKKKYSHHSNAKEPRGSKSMEKEKDESLFDELCEFYYSFVFFIVYYFLSITHTSLFTHKNTTHSHAPSYRSVHLL
jgi:hypothetical protein